MNPFRRKPKPTPAWTPDRPPLVRVQQQTPPSPFAGKWTPRDTADQHPPTARLEPGTAAFVPDRATLQARAAHELAAEVVDLHIQLAETERERDEEARINDDLRTRIKGLEHTVLTYASRK